MTENDQTKHTLCSLYINYEAHNTSYINGFLPSHIKRNKYMMELLLKPPEMVAHLSQLTTCHHFCKSKLCTIKLSHYNEIRIAAFN